MPGYSFHLTADQHAPRSLQPCAATSPLPCLQPHTQIFEDLVRKSPELYTRNGLLKMVQRNMGVKLAPERFQENK